MIEWVDFRGFRQNFVTFYIEKNSHKPSVSHFGVCFTFQGMFIKDSNSLAFYNFLNGAAVQLQLKERGGRKK